MTDIVRAMTRSGRWAVLATGAILGVAYAILTPPFEVPDEVFHFWRPLVIAGGQLLPQRRGEPDAGTIPLGAQNLVYVMSQKSGAKYTREQMRTAVQAPRQPRRAKGPCALTRSNVDPAVLVYGIEVSHEQFFSGNPLDHQSAILAPLDIAR